jgi:hypothetical protein
LSTLENNPLVALQEEFTSSYKRERFVANSPGYIPPREIKLPPDSSGAVRTFQYVPITELVKAIVSDPGFLPATPSQRDDVIHDVKDGSAWHSNPYFQENKNAFSLLLYSDELEICNPLGPAKGKQKILNIYMTLAEIPKHQRSKVENFFLVLTIRSKDFKGNREKVYKPFVDDLLKLEVGIPFRDGILQAGVLAHLGDNLEAHQISGLSTNFSRGNICRLCHIKV